MNAPVRLLVLAALVPLSLACQPDPCRDDAGEGTHGLVLPTSGADHFFHHPWPSDARRTPEGMLRVERFPNPTRSGTLDEYLEVIGPNTHGYSRNAAVYLSFDGPIDPASLPADPHATTEAEAAVQLVDVDPSSPERGRRFPLELRYGADSTVYLPAHHLIAKPPFGATLRPGTQYALVVTDRLRDPEGRALVAAAPLRKAVHAQCAPTADPELSGLLAPLRAFLESDGPAPERVVAATVFTTQDTVKEIRTLAEVARSLPPPEVTALEKVDEKADVMLIRGRVELPGFQRGRVPYLKPSDGGGLWIGADGRPQLDHTEDTRVGFMIPRGRPMPARGWPVVLMSHGTGASYRSAYDPAVATRLAELGIATVSYDPTLHGPRDPTGANVEVTFFNLFNILAGRDNVRQGAADCVVMTKLLQSGLEIPAAITGEGPARFDAQRVAFLGHSQGGLVGAGFIAAEPSIRAAVFSGTSGVMTITLLERRSPLDFLGLVRRLIAIDDRPEEVLDDLHPVLSLVQTFIEPADPIAYGPAWLRDPPDGAARDILMVEGFKDSASPARGHEALATAAGLPLVAPYFRWPAAAEFVGPEVQEAPAQSNLTVGGTAVTAGLIQYPEQDHWPMFEDPDANRRVIEFLRSSLIDGRATILPTGYR